VLLYRLIDKEVALHGPTAYLIAGIGMLATGVALFALRKQSVEQSRGFRSLAERVGLPRTSDRVHEIGIVLGAALAAAWGFAFVITGLVMILRG